MVLLVGLLWGQFRLGVLHPAYVPFLLLLVVLVLSTLVSLFLGGSCVALGPRRGAAALWLYVGVLPALFALAVTGHGMNYWRRGDVRPTFPFVLLATAGFSLGEAQAAYSYPHRLESEHLVMFYDDDVTDPQGDLDEMERHVTRLAEQTGRPLRAKIHWVRGPLLGQRYLALFGTALGTSESPPAPLDRHELAHAVLYQHNTPDTEPPMLLVEGWAESQSLDRLNLALSAEWLRDFTQRLGKMSADEREQVLEKTVQPDDFRQLARAIQKDGEGLSYLRELTGAFWYHHDRGPVYSVGGAFVDFLIRKYGMGKFIELYFACRPGTFEKECLRLFGRDLDALEKDFWEDVEQTTSIMQKW
jgi:hypothetical protein